MWIQSIVWPRRAVRRNAPVAALTSALLGLGAQAQTAAPAPQADAPTPALPTLTVSEPAPGSPTAPSVARHRQAVEQTAGSVGFIDNATLLDRYQSNLRDVLQEAPGVFTQNRYGQELRLSIRGSGIARGHPGRGVGPLQGGSASDGADGSGDF